MCHEHSDNQVIVTSSNAERPPQLFRWRLPTTPRLRRRGVGGRRNGVHLGEAELERRRHPPPAAALHAVPAEVPEPRAAPRVGAPQRPLRRAAVSPSPKAEMERKEGKREGEAHLGVPRRHIRHPLQRLEERRAAAGAPGVAYSPCRIWCSPSARGSVRPVGRAAHLACAAGRPAGPGLLAQAR